MLCGDSLQNRARHCAHIYIHNDQPFTPNARKCMKRPQRRSSPSSLHFKMMISKTRIMIRIIIIVICILSFAFLATPPRFFLALSSVV